MAALCRDTAGPGRMRLRTSQLPPLSCLLSSASSSLSRLHCTHTSSCYGIHLPPLAIAGNLQGLPLTPRTDRLKPGIKIPIHAPAGSLQPEVTGPPITDFKGLLCYSFIPPFNKSLLSTYYEQKKTLVQERGFSAERNRQKCSWDLGPQPSNPGLWCREGALGWGS